MAENKKAWYNRYAEVMENGSYEKLSDQERAAIMRKMYTTILIKDKRTLKGLYARMKEIQAAQKRLKGQLETVEKANILNKEKQQEIKSIIRMGEGVFKDTQQEIKEKGEFLAQNASMISNLLSDDDLRSILEISYEDMKRMKEEVVEEDREALLMYILMSWWAGEGVTVFGRALFLFIMGDPDYKKVMGNAFDMFLNTADHPIPTYKAEFNQQGEVVNLTQNPPKLQVVK